MEDRDRRADEPGAATDQAQQVDELRVAQQTHPTALDTATAGKTAAAVSGQGRASYYDSIEVSAQSRTTGMGGAFR